MIWSTALLIVAVCVALLFLAFRALTRRSAESEVDRRPADGSGADGGCYPIFVDGGSSPDSGHGHHQHSYDSGSHTESGGWDSGADSAGGGDSGAGDGGGDGGGGDGGGGGD